MLLDLQQLFAFEPGLKVGLKEAAPDHPWRGRIHAVGPDFVDVLDLQDRDIRCLDPATLALDLDESQSQRFAAAAFINATSALPTSAGRSPGLGWPGGWWAAPAPWLLRLLLGVGVDADKQQLVDQFEPYKETP